MFRLLLMIFALVSTSVFAQTESFTCQLKDFVILAIQDGKTERYASFTDSYKVGDTFRIELMVDGASASPSVEFKVSSGGKKLTLVMPVEVKKQLVASGDTITVSNEISEYVLDPDYLKIRAFFSELSLRRYYKGDWQGLWVGKENNESKQLAYLGTLNCMNASRAIDETYTRLFELAKP